MGGEGGVRGGERKNKVARNECVRRKDRRYKKKLKNYLGESDRCKRSDGSRHEELHAIGVSEGRRDHRCTYLPCPSLSQSLRRRKSSCGDRGCFVKASFPLSLNIEAKGRAPKRRRLIRFTKERSAGWSFSSGRLQPSRASFASCSSNSYRGDTSSTLRTKRDALHR